MLNKKQILEELEKLNLDKKQFVIISGAAMVLYGIKPQTSDIDIGISEYYLDYILKNFDCEFEKLIENDEVYFIDNKTVNFSTRYFDCEYEYIDKYRVQKIESIIKLKTILNRAKDKMDLQLIKSFLKKESKILPTKK